MRQIPPKICAVILVAGKGTRMGDAELPKPMRKVGGTPIIDRILKGVEEAVNIDTKPLLVVGFQGEILKTHLGERADYVNQEEIRGTGSAVACAGRYLDNSFDHIVVLNGDHPFVSSKLIDGLIATHLKSDAVATISTIEAENFEDRNEHLYDYGRVIRQDGRVTDIVECRDATPAQKEQREVNVGYYCFNLPWLSANIDRLRADNAKSEYYITDMVRLAVGGGAHVASFVADFDSSLGVNTPEQLERASATARKARLRAYYD